MMWVLAIALVAYVIEPRVGTELAFLFAVICAWIAGSNS